MLARSRDYLPRAALALAKLDRLDPGGKHANRPLRSLAEIFSLSAPWTDADLTKRMEIVDAVREHEPDVGWSLLLDIMPDSRRQVFAGARPRYREWAGKPAIRFSGPEFEFSVDETAARLLNDVGTDGRRWAQLLGVMSRMPEPRRHAAVKRLLELAGIGVTHAEDLRVALRDVVKSNRACPDAWWGLSASEVNDLEAALDSMRSDDVVEKHGWLFCWRPGVPKPPGTSQEPWRREVSARRIEAAREVLEGEGTEGLLRLASRAELPGLVGRTVGESGLLVDEDAFLDRVLGSPAYHEDRFCAGFVEGCFFRDGWVWADRKLVGVGKGWKAQQTARFLSFLPLDDRLRGLLGGLDTRTRKLFWDNADAGRIDGSSDILATAEGLLEHGRPYPAADALYVALLQNKFLPSALTVRTLQAVATSAPPEEYGPLRLNHVIAELLEVLHKHESVEEETLASLEWAFYGALKSTGQSPDSLYRLLGRDPGCFVELVGIVFKPDSEDSPEPTEESALRAEQALDLLESWPTLPGCRDDGTPDSSGLRNWLSKARAALEETDRASHGDYFFGRVLAKSPMGSDGLWPHEAVRDAVEWLASDEVEKNLGIEILNGRGTYTRNRFKGGDQEHELARRYRGYADGLSARWTRTANVLRDVAGQYERWALRSDRESELEQDL